MSNLFAFAMKVTGDERDQIKRQFDTAAVPSSFGYEWRIHDEVIRCDTQQGDGITVEPDAVIIKGETDWDLPFNLFQKMSQQYPNLTIEVQGTELTNLWSQRWIFKAGNGRLLDFVQEADNDEPRIAYMLDGEQLLPMPGWASGVVVQREAEADDLDRSDTTNESGRAVLNGDSGEDFLQALEVMERQQAENQLEDARRGSARRELNELLSKGHDPHTACCMVIYELLHVDADVVAGEYVESFLDWVFEGDAAERDRWRAMVGTDINGNQQTHDFNKEGF